MVKLSESVGGVPGLDAQTEDDVVDKDVHPTTRNTQQQDISNDQPNIPTHSPKVTFDEAPRIIQLPNAPTEPNLPPYQPLEKTPPHPEQPNVSAASEETGHQILVSAESMAPTVDKGSAESVEVFTQYIPQPCQEPESQEQSIQNEKETPGSSSQPSSSQPKLDINPDVGGGSQKKKKRRSTVRPPPLGQTFIPNQDPNKHPSFFIPVEGEDMSEASAGMHCYESEELDSVTSDDEDSQQAVFPQANPDAPVKEVRLELSMKFENLDHFKKAVRKFNINIGQSIFFPRVDSTSTYQFVIQPVPSQEYWQHVDLPPILPQIYKKHIGRPNLKRDKKNDPPKEPTPDPHRAPRKYGPITCKYCLKTGHNSRSCSKKKEAMAGSARSGLSHIEPGFTLPTHTPSAGGQSSSQHPAAEDDEEEETTLVPQPVPNPVRSPSTRPPTAKRPPKKKKNLRRPPPTT
ncbi:hypothetical protein Ahy_A05g024602 [Arachis hypogaea]|uniref:CCHC-type domain-containing protein n=1 Tax=Arachis hypogaea TaxID=3818 RepID=A0A445D661_ARAHY|nr:hypothetical protein Ahy_A05g024602 [Arachis hypogaea]